MHCVLINVWTLVIFTLLLFLRFFKMFILQYNPISVFRNNYSSHFLKYMYVVDRYYGSYLQTKFQDVKDNRKHPANCVHTPV